MLTGPRILTRVVCLVVLSHARLLAQGPTHSDTRSIRVCDEVVESLVQTGLARSATFRRMHQQIEQSNLVLHVRRTATSPRDSGFTQFVGAVGAFRYVRITLNVDGVSASSIALLGHELRHALELAARPDVDDIRAYRRLYSRIGYRSCPKPRECFDTAEAVEAGRQVLRELRRGPAKAKRSGQDSGGWPGHRCVSPVGP